MVHWWPHPHPHPHPHSHWDWQLPTLGAAFAPTHTIILERSELLAQLPLNNDQFTSGSSQSKILGFRVGRIFIA